MTKKVLWIGGAIAVTGVLIGGGWWLREELLSRPVDLSKLTTDEWRDDLHYMAQKLAARHANAFHRVTREEYERIVAEIDAAIPKLSPQDLPVEFAKLTAVVGDAHTFLSLPGGQHLFPFGVYYFGREARVTRADAANRDLLGARLVKIDDTEMSGVEAKLDEILTRGENASYYLGHYPWLLSSEVLHALGVARETTTATFTFAMDDGSTIARAMAPTSKSVDSWVRPYAQAPLYLEHENDDFWFTLLPGTKNVYVAFNSYRQLSANAARLFELLDHGAVERLIIDLRGNGGGDYLEGHAHLIAPLLERPALNQPGHLFVITGRYTFSAAMNNAAQFHTETHATLVGEPPGEAPNSYQERRSFRLPNSHLRVNYSVDYYKFLPEDVPALLPDQEVDPDWESYRAGLDPALEWILAQAGRGKGVR